jgi:ABC-2 type transport system ATP-binding protein
MDAIATHELCKSYGRCEALHNLNLDVPSGSLFGFLGPNGAGKTTVIRILLGLLRASAGQARLFGLDAWQAGPRARAEVGYLPGDVRFDDHLTGRQTLSFFAAARRQDARAEIKRLGARFDVDLDLRVRSYSRGMKQKLGLIQVLMHRPRLLLLDEPTTALDPLIRRILNEELRTVAGEGRTVLFSSHTLSEVEELCDQVAILREGRLVVRDTIAALRARAPRRVELRFDAGAAAPAEVPPGLAVVEQTERRLTGTWTGPLQGLVVWLARCQVEDVSIGAPSLEDVFLAHYQTGPEREARA